MIQHYGPFGSAVSGGDRVSGPWTEWQGFRAMGSPSEPRRPFQDLGQSHYLSEGLRFRTRDSAGTIPSQRQLPCCMSNAWQPPPPPHRHHRLWPACSLPTQASCLLPTSCLNTNPMRWRSGRSTLRDNPTTAFSWGWNTKGSRFQLQIQLTRAFFSKRT